MCKICASPLILNNLEGITHHHALLFPPLKSHEISVFWSMTKFVKYDQKKIIQVIRRPERDSYMCQGQHPERTGALWRASTSADPQSDTTSYSSWAIRKEHENVNHGPLRVNMSSLSAWGGAHDRNKRQHRKAANKHVMETEWWFIASTKIHPISWYMLDMSFQDVVC